MHGEQKTVRGSSVQGRGDLEKVFDFYALLATCFSLLIRHVVQRGACVMILALLRRLQC